MWEKGAKQHNNNIKETIWMKWTTLFIRWNNIWANSQILFPAIRNKKVSMYTRTSSLCNFVQFRVFIFFSFYFPCKNTILLHTSTHDVRCILWNDMKTLFGFLFTIEKLFLCVLYFQQFLSLILSTSFLMCTTYSLQCLKTSKPRIQIQLCLTRVCIEACNHFYWKCLSFP